MLYQLFLILNLGFSSDLKIDFCNTNTLNLNAYRICMNVNLSMSALQSCRIKSASSNLFVSCMLTSQRRNLDAKEIRSCANTTFWDLRFLECLENIN